MSRFVDLTFSIMSVRELITYVFLPDVSSLTLSNMSRRNTVSKYQAQMGTIKNKNIYERKSKNTISSSSSIDGSFSFLSFFHFFLFLPMTSFLREINQPQVKIELTLLNDTYHCRLEKDGKK